MILHNGRLSDKQDVRISVDDRGYYFGDGVYEVFRIYNGALFEADAHLARLQRSADEVRLKLPYPLDAIRSMLEKLRGAERVTEGMLYMQITRGEAPRSHTFPDDAVPNLVAWCKPLPRPLNQLKHGIDAVTVEDVRWLRCDIKSLNLLPNTLAKQQAADSGADEAVFVRGGIVTECSASNLMIVKNGELWTHPANHLILHGITRGVVLRLSAELAIPVREQPFGVDALMTADEAFITGTTVEITPVVRIDGAPVGTGTPGPVTRRLQAAFAQYAGLAG